MKTWPTKPQFPMSEQALPERAETQCIRKGCPRLTKRAYCEHCERQLRELSNG